MKELKDLTLAQLETMLPLMGKKARALLKDESWEITADEGYTRKDVQYELDYRLSTFYYSIHMWPTAYLEEALSYKIDVWFRLAQQGRNLPHLEISATPRDYSFWYKPEALRLKLSERQPVQV